MLIRKWTYGVPQLAGTAACTRRSLAIKEDQRASNAQRGTRLITVGQWAFDPLSQTVAVSFAPRPQGCEVLLM